MRLTPTLLIALGFSTALHAQASTGAARQYPARPDVRGVGVHSDYDAQYDKTVLQLDPTPLDASLRLSALVALDGREVRKEADGVVLTIWSTAPQKRFQEKRAVSIAIDGAPPVSMGSASLQPNGRPGFSEIMMKSVSLDQWLALAAAHTARLTVGDFTYDLSPQLIAAIRDFASQMAPRK